MTINESTKPKPLAAIDIGSNSFHLIIAEPFQDEFRILDKRRDKVQLAAGLDHNKKLSDEAIARGISCLHDFSQRIQGFDQDQVRILATNAMRVATNRQSFLEQAEQVLPYPIEIISGREEARLIYTGVSHTIADNGGNRLIFDIGGGSTECILGQGFKPRVLESLHMGCVSYTRRFFPDGEISIHRFRQATNAAKRELLNIEPQLDQFGWQVAIGSSGTIRTAETIALRNGWCDHHLTLTGLTRLIDFILTFDRIDDIELAGVRPDRRSVFIGGLAILSAIFDVFDIKEMIYSDGALREGILWEMRGGNPQQDIRSRTIESLQDRFHIDRSHGHRVADTASHLFNQACDSGFIPAMQRPWLLWAAQLHEVGLSLSHSGFHRHGHYLLKNADLLGFTRQGQVKLANLVRLHRRKFGTSFLAEIPVKERQEMLILIRLLRLSVILNLYRGGQPTIPPKLTIIEEDTWQLDFSEDWPQQHPLIARDLYQEMEYQKAVGLTLKLNPTN